MSIEEVHNTMSIYDLYHIKAPHKLHNQSTKVINDIINKYTLSIYQLMNNASVNGECFINYKIPDEVEHISDIYLHFGKHFKAKGFAIHYLSDGILISWFNKADIIRKHVIIIYQMMDEASSNGEFEIYYRPPDEIRCVGDILQYLVKYFKANNFYINFVSNKINIDWRVRVTINDKLYNVSM